MSDLHLSAIPMAELLADRTASQQDILVCNRALWAGVTEHKDGFSVQKRIDQNWEIIDRIDAELARRAQALRHNLEQSCQT